jgi:transcriptional regulator with XRE-family HTH domain
VRSPKAKDIGDGRQTNAVSIGEVLAEARHRRGFTVAEVSHYTRIRESIIRGIERDDYLLCGSDAHARGDIRIIATALGLDPDPLIREFDTTYPSEPDPAETEMVRPTIPFARFRGHRIRWLPALLALVLVLALAVVGFVANHFVAGTSTGSGSPAVSSGGAASPGSASPASSVAPALVPVRVQAFGPDGTADGDNPKLAALATDTSAATAWMTGRYGSAHFGALPSGRGRSGTGLLLDLGHEVTITSAEVTLGTRPGAGFEMLAGNTPSRADLRVVAFATKASGALGVRFATPVHARYVLIWFTVLPPDGAGTFQASVYNITVQGENR